MTTTTNTGHVAYVQLFGGYRDGESSVPAPLHNGTLPATITFFGLAYHADGTTGDGTPRYSLPQYAGQLTRRKAA